MPQAIQELQDEFGTGDEIALKYLEEKGFTFAGGIIRVSNKDAWKDEKAQREALFMVQEWDYEVEDL